MPDFGAGFDLNPQRAREKARAADAEEKRDAELRSITIERVSPGHFDVECTYVTGRHDRQELDAEGVRAKVGELVGEAEPADKLGELAGIIPDDATKGKLKVSFKREGDEEDEE